MSHPPRLHDEKNPLLVLETLGVGEEALERSDADGVETAGKLGVLAEANELAQGLSGCGGEKEKDEEWYEESGVLWRQKGEGVPFRRTGLRRGSSFAGSSRTARVSSVGGMRGRREKGRHVRGRRRRTDAELSGSELGDERLDEGADVELVGQAEQREDLAVGHLALARVDEADLGRE